MDNKLHNFREFLKGDHYIVAKRISNPWNAIGRRILMVDELPHGALARYEKDVQSVSYILGREQTRKEKLVRWFKGEEYTAKDRINRLYKIS